MGEFIEARLTTSLGEVNAVSWGDEFVIQSLYEDGRDKGITINRVLYSVRLDVSLTRGNHDDVWVINHLYISRLNGVRYDEATYAARSKAQNVLLAALIAHVREHPEFVGKGNLKRLEREIGDKKHDLALLEGKRIKIAKELDALFQELATSTKQPFTEYHNA